MNKKLLWIILAVVLVGAGSYTAYRFFRADDTHFALIPKDSDMVVKINLVDILEKADNKGKLQDLKFFKELKRDFSNKPSRELNSIQWILKKVSDDPKSSGLGLNQPVFFVLRDFERRQFALVCNMRNVDNFNRLVLKMPEVEGELKRTKDYFFLNLPNDHLVMAWNEKGLVMIGEKPSYSLYSSSEDGTDLLPEVDKYFKLKDEDSKKSDKAFAAFVKKEGDVSFSISGAVMGKGGQGLITEAEGRSVAINAYLTFEKDRIHIGVGYSGEKDIINKISYVKEKGVGDVILSNLSSKDGLAYVTSNVDMNRLYNDLNRSAAQNNLVQQAIDMYASALGISLIDLKSSFTGEMGLAIERLEVKTVLKEVPDYNYETGEISMVMKEVPEPNLVMNAVLGINNSAVMDKIKAKTNPRDTTDGVSYFSNGAMAFYLVNNNTSLFITTSLDNALKFRKNGFVNKTPELKYVADAGKYCSQAYISTEYSRYSTMLNQLPFMAVYGKKVENAMNELDGIEMHNESSVQGELNINFKKGDGNSLFRILKMIDGFQN